MFVFLFGLFWYVWANFHRFGMFGPRKSGNPASSASKTHQSCTHVDVNNTNAIQISIQLSKILFTQKHKFVVVQQHFGFTTNIINFSIR
jgi:hypothetical protein